MTAEKCLICEKPSAMLPPGHTLGCCSIECAAIAANVAWRGIETRDGGVEVTDIVIGDMKRSRVHDHTEIAVVTGRTSSRGLPLSDRPRRMIMLGMGFHLAAEALRGVRRGEQVLVVSGDFGDEAHRPDAHALKELARLELLRPYQRDALREAIEHLNERAVDDVLVIDETDEVVARAIQSVVPLEHKTVYVSPDGNDYTGDGSLKKPLASVPPADFSQAELRVFCQQLVDSEPTGLSIETLAKYAGITVEQAQAYRERLLAKWPQMKAYMDAQAKYERHPRDKISDFGGLPPNEYVRSGTYTMRPSYFASGYSTFGLGEPKISLEPPPDPPRAFKKGTFFPPETIAPGKRGNAHTKRNQMRSKKGRGR